MSTIESRDRTTGRDEQPRVMANRVRDYLEKLDVFRSAGLEELYLNALNELAEVILEPLAFLLENPWRSSKVLDD